MQPGPHCCAAVAGGCHGDQPHCCNALSCDFFVHSVSHLLVLRLPSQLRSVDGQKGRGHQQAATSGHDLRMRRAAQEEAGLNNAEIAGPPVFNMAAHSF